MKKTEDTGVKRLFKKLFKKNPDDDTQSEVSPPKAEVESQDGSTDDWKKKYKDLTVTEIQNRGIGTL